MIAAIALDLGSTSIKAGLLAGDGRLYGIVTRPVPPVRAEGGCYESDALAYAAIADQVLQSCLEQADCLPPLGLCSQRSSFLIWDQASGQPLTPLISWQDNRGAASCSALQAQEPRIVDLSGLRLAPYYFAPKLRVLLQQHPAWRERLLQGELRLGTLDSFLIWRWTDGRQHFTDASMAARTLLLDIGTQQWSLELGEMFDIPLQILPAIKPSAGWNLALNNGLILQASLADQSAALLASVGTASEVALVNLGTGGFVIRYLPEPHRNSGGYLRTLVYQDHDRQGYFASEGTLNSIAAALAGYPLAECSPYEMGAIGDIYCLAEPSGLGAPYFRSDLGMQFSAPVTHLTQGQIACLLLEAIVFRVARIVEEFQRDAGIGRVYLSGGLSELACLQQGIAQCVSCEVFRLQQKDASLQGAALLAAGLRLQGGQESDEILNIINNICLRDKYSRWKQWLDRLLES